MADDTKSKLQTRTLLVANLPVDGHKREIEQYFGEAGPIKKVFIVRDQGGSYKGLAYITYAEPEDATKAVKQYNNAILDGKVLRVKYSKQRDREQQDNNEGSPKKNEGSPNKKEADTFEKKEKKDFNKQDKKHVFIKRTKEESEAAKAKSARLIIRNISYQAKEADIRKHFSKFGEVVDVALLKRKDGKMVGCGFVQLASKISAMQAIKECNMKPLLGRAIAVDWAIPKDQFTAKQQKTDDEGIADISTGETTEDQTMDDDDDSGVDGKSDDESSDCDESEEGENSESEGDDDSEEEDDSEQEDDETDKRGSRIRNDPPFNKEADASSKDVEEGRTLFVKNLPFDASEEDIAEVLGKYGDLKYVLLVMDKLTEHPRGTAFVQYKTREGADACLTAADDSSKQGEFSLMGRTMYPMRAIGRGDVNKMKVDKDKDKEKKDKRNLYLAREGMIREGTKAASGMSKSDLELRTHRQRVKQKMLLNFHTFVSMTRLCVHNLPEDITDRKLGEIFIDNAPDEAKIIESKAMLNFKDVAENGKAKSKGYGFVAFSEHEHALAALRRVNNNPDIFTHEKRPIVEFSLENRTALKARENRQKKSKEKNPVWQEKQIQDKEKEIKKKKERKEIRENNLVGQGKQTQNKDNETHKTNETKQSKKNIKIKGKQFKKKTNDAETSSVAETSSAPDQTVPDYIGSQAKPGEGTTRAMPTHSGPKIRHRDRNVAGKGKITRKQLRKQQQDKLKGKKRPWQENNAGGSNQPNSNKKQKIEGALQDVKTKKTSKKPFSKKFKGDAESDKKFQSMVAQYKKKMNSNAPSVPEKRWFE